MFDVSPVIPYIYFDNKPRKYSGIYQYSIYLWSRKQKTPNKQQTLKCNVGPASILWITYMSLNATCWSFLSLLNPWKFHFRAITWKPLLRLRFDFEFSEWFGLCTDLRLSCVDKRMQCSPESPVLLQRQVYHGV